MARFSGWRPRGIRVLAASAVATLLAGCTGEVGGDPRPQGAAAGGMGTGGAAGAAAVGGSATTGTLDCSQHAAPRAPLRRLTRFDYNNTVRDLWGVTTRPADALPGEEVGNGFGNDADALGVSPLLIDGYRSVAHELASKLTAPAALVAFAGCDPAVDEAGCVTSFIDSFGKKAFRRPLEDSERSALRAMFDKGKQLGGGAIAGISAVVELVLQSPQFLYRVEFGTAVDAAKHLARPTSYEMAARLSYLLWGSAPDDALIAAAEKDELQTPEQVKAQAERLLADQRSHDVVTFFHGQLLGTRGLDSLVRSGDYYPNFAPGLGSLYRQETEQFVDYVMWQDKGDLATLFSAPYTFLNERLAKVYGISGVTGDAFQKVALDPAQRGGLLTQPSILSLTTPGSRTDPVVRGKWVFTRLMCGKVADPPPNVPQLADPAPGLSVRDRLAQHRAAPVCGACHQLMDPIGFGFEHYDGMGQWRDSDNDLPIDSSGNIPIGDQAGPFNGVVELGQKLSQSKDVQRCFVGYWLTYGYGRSETPEDQCTRSQLEAAFAASGGRVRDLLLALTQTDAFLYRPLP